MSRLVLTGVVLAAVVLAGEPEFTRARELYNMTEYDGALKILLAMPVKDGGAYDLIGRSYYMSGDFRRASESFQKAVGAEPLNSAFYDWLGKAFGRRAETSNFVTAPGYAAKARDNFERAVALDDRNLEAVNDLLEYYLQAPGFLGGGLDKATMLAERLGNIDPAESSYAKAMIAEHRKEFGQAEQQLRRAVNLAPRQVGRLIDLAKFLSKQGRYDEADRTFQQAERMEPRNAGLMFAKASDYIHTGRNLDQARQLLQQYLKSPLTPEDPPREEALRLLRQANGG